MISFANKNTETEVRRLWKTCFNDPDNFMDLYFSEKYKNENTLVWIENGEVAASLQMLPYLFTFCKKEIPVSYISGACTLEKYRKQGYMKMLLEESFKVMRKREISISVLIPAEDWLYGYYAKHGYEKVFDAGKEPVPLKGIYENAEENIDIAYQSFNSIFRKKDFCIQKTKSDFETIIKDAIMFNFPPRSNVSGMARIIDAKMLLSLFAEKYPDKSFEFEINDNILKENNFSFKVHNGSFSAVKNNAKVKSLNINTLCRLLFGYHLDELPYEESKNFVPHDPIMNLMIE